MTRDNSLIIQEIWDKAYEVDYFDNKNPYLPTHINYVNNGVVEIWENKKAINWFCDSLQEKHKVDKKFITHIIKSHKITEKKLQKILENDYLDNVDKLKKFIKLLKNGTYSYLAYYHSAYDSRTPSNIKKELIKIREEDAFYDLADSIIKKSIEYIFPKTKNLSISVLSNELESLPDIKILKQRFKNSIFITNKRITLSDLVIFSKKNKSYIFKFDKLPEKNILKGQIACTGKVKGKVRIIKRKNQINKFKKDEILVSPMTTPDFVPAMKKAKAIITDEGGITCHAAILSRELKIPCIIGTKVATEFLKNGDLVEVDASKGNIKIIK
jgi:phosphoenolpyruvate synthase/pyruvate phosphate dikinase